MTNAQMTEAQRTLSVQALTALINTPPRQGAAVPAVTPAVRAELSGAGMIGPGGGLTRAGEIVRMRELERRFEASF